MWWRKCGSQVPTWVVQEKGGNVGRHAFNKVIEKSGLVAFR